MAHVVLNGKDLGILWKPPYWVEITGTVIAGKNHLEIQVANLWPNRLTGDEQFPPDAEWSKAFLAKWPPWLLAGQPSPAGRISFTTYRAWFKDSPLQPSGLIGPVRIDFAQTIRLP